MQKIKKTILVVITICFLFAIPVSANSYSFPFPSSANYLGSMRWSSGSTRTNASAYVYPNATTISTKYFLTPTYGGNTQATAVVTISTRAKRYFSWLSGYGGTGVTYYLAGYPDPTNGTWDAYSIAGTWVD